jgi:hypothetical protein
MFPILSNYFIDILYLVNVSKFILMFNKAEESADSAMNIDRALGSFRKTEFIA